MDGVSSYSTVSSMIPMMEKEVTRALYDKIQAVTQNIARLRAPLYKKNPLYFDGKEISFTKSAHKLDQSEYKLLAQKLLPYTMIRSKDRLSMDVLQNFFGQKLLDNEDDEDTTEAVAVKTTTEEDSKGEAERKDTAEKLKSLALTAEKTSMPSPAASTPSAAPASKSKDPYAHLQVIPINTANFQNNQIMVIMGRFATYGESEPGCLCLRCYEKDAHVYNYDIEVVPLSSIKNGYYKKYDDTVYKKCSLEDLYKVILTVENHRDPGMLSRSKNKAYPNIIISVDRCYVGEIPLKDQCKELLASAIVVSRTIPRMKTEEENKQRAAETLESQRLFGLSMLLHKMGISSVESNMEIMAGVCLLKLDLDIPTDSKVTRSLARQILQKWAAKEHPDKVSPEHKGEAEKKWIKVMAEYDKLMKILPEDAPTVKKPVKKAPPQANARPVQDINGVD